MSYLTRPVVDTIIKILFVAASNITYLLVSLFILYIGIILYVDGDYLYNKVKDFAISRCKYEIFYQTIVLLSCKTSTGASNEAS